MGWLKSFRINGVWREWGHANPGMGWSEVYPIVRRFREGGHGIASKVISKLPSKSNCLSRRGHTTDSKLATDAAPRTPNHSDHAHSSIVALCTRVSKGSPHDKRRARTTGTRLEVRPVFELRVWSVGGDHKLLGALSLTPTLNVGAPLHAPQNSSEASCSSNVDTYQRFLPPSHAWFKVTMKASRQRAVPPTDGRGAEIETH